MVDAIGMYTAVAAACKIIIDWVSKIVPETNLNWQPIASVAIGVFLCWLFDMNIMTYFTDVEGVKYFGGFIITGLLIGSGSNGINNLVELAKIRMRL